LPASRRLRPGSKNCAPLTGTKPGRAPAGVGPLGFPREGQQGNSHFGATGIPPAPHRVRVTFGARDQNRSKGLSLGKVGGPCDAILVPRQCRAAPESDTIPARPAIGSGQREQRPQSGRATGKSADVLPAPPGCSAPASCRCCGNTTTNDTRADTQKIRENLRSGRRHPAKPVNDPNPMHGPRNSNPKAGVRPFARPSAVRSRAMYKLELRHFDGLFLCRETQTTPPRKPRLRGSPGSPRPQRHVRQQKVRQKLDWSPTVSA